MAIGELEYDHTDFSKDRAGDERLAVRFFRKARQDSEETAKQGRPIFKDEDYVQIVVPGDRSSAIVRPVGPMDRMRFAKQYEHWQKTQQEELLQGTPLEAWGILSLSQVEEFRYFGIRTIDQMAELRDDVCQKIMGATTLKQKAQGFMQIAKDEAPLRKVQAELDKRDNEIASLKNSIEEQGKLLQELRDGRVTPPPARAKAKA
jgi:hypothetical protein